MLLFILIILILCYQLVNKAWARVIMINSYLLYLAYFMVHVVLAYIWKKYSYYTYNAILLCF